jgi:outer membrane protein assembly factor BamB
MIRFFLPCLIFMASTLIATAQPVSSVAEVPLQGTGRAVFMHEFTGIPIVQTDKTYTGVHPMTHKVLWEVARSGGAAFVESVGGDAALDYFDLYNTPFAYLKGSIINVFSGQILVDGAADEIKSFEEYYILPESGLVLLELFAKGKIRLYALDPFTSKKVWDIDLREKSGLGQLMASAETSGPKPIALPPLVTASGNLLYHNDKFLASVELKSGKLLWNKKLNPGYIYLNDDATRLLVAEQRGGGLMGLSAGGLDKTLYLLDANTGESLWSKGDSKMGGDIQFIAPYGNDYMVVHDEGFNIYNYNPDKSATGRWKKDYAEKEIKNVVIQDDGLMVYFKNRRMLISAATGEDLWKKAEKLEREPSAYSMGRRSRVTEVAGAKIFYQGGSLYVTVGKNTQFHRCETWAVDEANKRVVITRNSNPGVTTIGAPEYDALAVDLTTGNVAYGKFSIRKGVQSVEAVGNNGYFFYNDRGFVLMTCTANAWAMGKEGYFPDPAEGERVAKAALAGLALESARLSTAAGGTAAVISNDPAAYAKYESRMNAIDAGSDLASAATKRRAVGQLHAEHAYFFSRNKDKELVLYKVEKRSGETVKEFLFSSKETMPIYKVDNFNKKIYYIEKSQLQIFNL